MAINLVDGFNVTVAKPLDGRSVVADLTARDAIASGVRYDGMPVYVEAEETTYRLKGGITNGDWAEDGAGVDQNFAFLGGEVNANFGMAVDELFNAFLIDASGGSLTFTLPATFDRLVYLKRIDNSANVVTIDVDTGKSIDDVASMPILKKNDALILAYHSANDQYYVLGNKVTPGIDTESYFTYIYGDNSTDGSIRINTQSGDFTVQKRVAGAWTFIGSFGE